MTKPPKGNNSDKKKIKYNQKKINNKVIIMTNYTRLYTIDKETEKIMELYNKEFGIEQKIPKNIAFTGKYYRKCNYFYLISTLFLCSSIFFACLGVDNIEPRKIISCEEDLDNNFYISLCLNFRPKYTFYTGEQVLFNDNCIIKEDEEKVKEFNDNYNKMLKVINQREEEEKKLEEKFNKLGISRGCVLFYNTLGNLRIKAFISGYEKIVIDLLYVLDGYKDIISLTYQNSLQITDDIDLDCLKEGFEREGELTYLYIKYLKYPIIIGDFNALTYSFSYRGKENTFSCFPLH